ncbi:MAG: hypothetical protein M1377_07460 [Deltaproteobacteria bacterium]|nr:hypothetical protein [Deltaproteobacteria bacterium]
MLEGSPRTYRHSLARPSVYRIGFSLAKWVPRPVLYVIADLLADVTHRAGAEPVRNLRANLRLAFPHFPERDIEDILKRTFRNFARYLVDYGRFHTLTEEVLDRVLPSVEGLHPMEESLRKGRGVILVTGHIGNWELGGVFFGRNGVKINVVTLPEGSDRIDAIRGRYRKRHNIRTIVLDGSPFSSLEIVAALRRGEMVAMLVDRWGGGDGVSTKFFGVDRLFPRGPFILSRVTGAPVVPAFVVRDGNTYRGVVDPPFVVEGVDDEPYARRVSETLERMIRNFPDQWYNFAAY